MYCPHTIVFSTRLLMITLHTKADYMVRVPLVERLNLLRYSCTLHPGTKRHFTINKDGAAATWLANALWRLKGGGS